MKSTALPVEFVFPRQDVATAVRKADSIEDTGVLPDFLIIDSRVSEFYLERLFPGGKGSFCFPVVELNGGEQCKTPRVLNQLWDEMSRAELRKDSRVVVIGGGTVCDAGAFAASTWKRGVNLTLVPSTLLCMVDASLGGKTAVNISGGKNQAGTVYPASEIVICTEFLETLPLHEMVNGLAEALKTAVIGDRQIVKYLLAENYIRAVEACLAVKGRIVAADLEETGERRLLNLGHTVGHCIEAATDFKVGHGAAVAMGIPVASEIGGNHGFSVEFSRIAAELGIGTEIPSGVTVREILNRLESDKKTLRDGRIWIIPRGWEDCEQIMLSRRKEEELLRKVWR